VRNPRHESGESEPGTHEGAGARSSIGWQKSVGRIARLLHREVARPVGGERALAGRKSVAPPDAGRGWVEGEPVRVRGISKQSSRVWPVGFGLQVLDTMEGVLGLLPALLSPAGRRRVLRLGGQFRIIIREEHDDGQRIGRLQECRLGRACG
jgi:hypothetical protein